MYWFNGWLKELEEILAYRKRILIIIKYNWRTSSYGTLGSCKVYVQEIIKDRRKKKNKRKKVSIKYTWIDWIKCIRKRKE